MLYKKYLTLRLNDTAALDNTRTAALYLSIMGNAIRDTENTEFI